MPFDLQDIEQLANAIAHVNGHPTAADYAKSVATAWHELFIAPPASTDAPAPEGEVEVHEDPQA